MKGSGEEGIFVVGERDSSLSNLDSLGRKKEEEKINVLFAT